MYYSQQSNSSKKCRKPNKNKKKILIEGLFVSSCNKCWEEGEMEEKSNLEAGPRLLFLVGFPYFKPNYFSCCWYRTSSTFGQQVSSSIIKNICWYMRVPVLRDQLKWQIMNEFFQLRGFLFPLFHVFYEIFLYFFFYFCENRHVLKSGFHVTAIRPPTVAPNSCR